MSLTRCLRCRSDAKDGPGRDRHARQRGDPSFIAFTSTRMGRSLVLASSEHCMQLLGSDLAVDV